MLLQYNIYVNGRALNTIKKDNIKLHAKNNYLKSIRTTIIHEMVKSSAIEVATEATFQPLLQLYALIASNPNIYEEFKLLSILDSSIAYNFQVYSILTSIASFCWTMTAYHVYVKRGALDLGISLKSRILLFASILFYIV